MSLTCARAAAVVRAAGIFLPQRPRRLCAAGARRPAAASTTSTGATHGRRRHPGRRSLRRAGVVGRRPRFNPRPFPAPQRALSAPTDLDIVEGPLAEQLDLRGGRHFWERDGGRAPAVTEERARWANPAGVAALSSPAGRPLFEVHEPHKAPGLLSPSTPAACRGPRSYSWGREGRLWGCAAAAFAKTCFRLSAALAAQPHAAAALIFGIPAGRRARRRRRRCKGLQHEGGGAVARERGSPLRATRKELD